MRRACPQAGRRPQQQNHVVRTRAERDRTEKAVARAFEGYAQALEEIPAPSDDEMVDRYVESMRQTAKVFRAIQRAAAARDFPAAARLVERLDGPTEDSTRLQKPLKACP